MVWAANSGLQALCIFRLLRVSNLCEDRTKAVVDLKLMVGWGEHKVVLDKHRFRVYNWEVDWGPNFVSVEPIGNSRAAVQTRKGFSSPNFQRVGMRPSSAGFLADDA